MVQSYEEVVSNIETKMHIAIFCTGCKILYITLLTSTVVEYYYFGRQKMCKIKMDPFLKHSIDFSTNDNVYFENGVFRNS